MNKNYNFQNLIEIMQSLRHPTTGCPWDLDQDFETIAPHTIEEAYEVEDAIKKGNYTELEDELGDLLFQPIFHAQIASDKGLFDIHDVVHKICDKMIRRHPHVFKDTKAKTASDVNVIWDTIKKEEKQGSDSSALDGVPLHFPALLRAHKLQKRAANVGFEWDNISGVLDKLNEEISELQETKDSKSRTDFAEELGDVFFVLVNYARMNGFNAEDIMRDANRKFENRFKLMEATLVKQGKSTEDASLDEMEAAWLSAKKQEKATKPSGA